jgi:hypothetical protein
MLTLNAHWLITNGPKAIPKFEGLQRKLARSGWPDIVVLTEVSGYTGANLCTRFKTHAKEVAAKYDMHWTTRATNSTGGHASCRTTAGGGVAILWAKRLRLQKPRLEVPDVGGEEEMTKLKGHLLSLRFDPPAAGSVPRRRMPLIDRTLIVIGAYIPPAGDWATFAAATAMKGLRLLLERALPVRRYRGAFVLVAGHFNARTGDGPVELKFAQDGFMTERIEAECAAARANSAGAHQVARVEMSGGSTLLHRVRCKGASDTDARGRELTDMISTNGMCFVPGVLNYPPTSWEL